MAKATERLSALRIRNLKKPGFNSDGGNLYLAVDERGNKRWIFRYRWRGKVEEGKTPHKFIDAGLGPLVSTSAKQARERAREGRAMLNEVPRRSPLAVWKERLRLSSTPTLEEMAEVYFARKASEWKSERHRAQIEANLRKHCAPIANKLVNEITVEDVQFVISTYAKLAPSSALKLRGTIEGVLNVAKALGHNDRSLPNPAAWRGSLDQLLAKAPKPTHHAAMDYRNLPTFMGKLREMQQDPTGRVNVVVYALQLIILTAARSGEVRCAKWSEVDFDRKLWIVPSERMKTAKEHRVPLSDDAIAIFQKMLDLRVSDYVFPSGGKGQPPTQKSFQRLMKKLKAEGVVHGLRSSFRNWAGNQTNFPREICELALAHSIGNSVERAYHREHAEGKHRALLTAWATYLAHQSANVITMPRKAG
jgi:integrase